MLNALAHRRKTNSQGKNSQAKQGGNIATPLDPQACLAESRMKASDRNHAPWKHDKEHDLQGGLHRCHQPWLPGRLRRRGPARSRGDRDGDRLPAASRLNRWARLSTNHPYRTSPNTISFMNYPQPLRSPGAMSLRTQRSRALPDAELEAYRTPPLTQGSAIRCHSMPSLTETNQH